MYINLMCILLHTTKKKTKHTRTDEIIRQKHFFFKDVAITYLVMGIKLYIDGEN